MLRSILMCILSVFSVIGIIFSIKYIIGEICCRHNKNPYIVIGVKDKGESIEGIVRLMMKSHPSSEILVIDYGSSDDTKEVVEKLCRDYECVNLAEK